MTNSKLIEKSKHEYGTLVITENHYPISGTRFISCTLTMAKRALKKNPKLPLLLSVTDKNVADAKLGLAKALERYLK